MSFRSHFCRMGDHFLQMNKMQTFVMSQFSNLTCFLAFNSLPNFSLCYMLLASLRSHLSNPYIFFTIQSGKNLRVIFSYFFLIQDVIRLNFFSEPDGPVMGNGAFKSSILVPGYVVWMIYLYCFLHAVFLLYYIYQLKFFW